MTIALVTGSQGFVGSHLRALLVGEGWTVVGVGRSEIELIPGERYLRVDVTVPDEMAAALDAIRPDVVFHLAAVSGQNVSDPVQLVQGAVIGTQSVCSGLRRVGLHSRLVLAGSSAQYGATSSRRTHLVESDPCEPVSTYGYAKAAAEATAFALSTDGAFELVAVRAFNHVGPGEPSSTVCGALAARVVSVAEGRAEGFAATDLDAVRDFTDVRDIARGYLALAMVGVPGRVYNLCSGRGSTVGHILDVMLRASGLDRSIVDIRPGDGSGISSQVGSPARVEADTGWISGIPLDDSLADLLASLRGGAAPTGSERRAREGSIGGI